MTNHFDDDEVYRQEEIDFDEIVEYFQEIAESGQEEQQIEDSALEGIDLVKQGEVVAKSIKYLKRQTSDKELTPLAFVFEPGIPQRTYFLYGVYWDEDTTTYLLELRRRLQERKNRRSLPIAAFRSHFEVVLPETVAFVKDIGLRHKDQLLCWVESSAENTQQKANQVFLAWLVECLSGYIETQEEELLVRQLKELARENEAIRAEKIEAKPFVWDVSQGHTAKIIGRTSYAELANFVALQLEGAQVFPDTDIKLRRIVSSDLYSNQAELMTDPIEQGNKSFSFVIRVKVLSFPGRSTPVIVINFTKRVWTTSLNLKSMVKTVSGYALPTNSNRAYRFSLEKQKRANREYEFVLAHDFAPISRRYFPERVFDTQDILQTGLQLRECRLLVGLKHGVGERSELKSGVPDLDKIEAFDRIAKILEKIQLVPWQALKEVQSSVKSIKDYDQAWRKRENPEEKERRKYLKWRDNAQQSIKDCYQGEHHLIIAVQAGAESDAEQAQQLLSDILGDSVITKILPIPNQVHGPYSALPSKELKNPERAAVRIQAWQDFVESVKIYEQQVGKRINGVLVIAREWYSSHHDDVINKRSARVALAKGVGVPIQYLRPLGEEQERRVTISKRTPSANQLKRDFEQRLMNAWLDLAYKSLGRVKTHELAQGLIKSFGTDPLPDRVLALGVIRRNSTIRLANDPSIVPYAIELDLETGICNACYAYEDPKSNTLKYSEFLPMPQVLVNLASLGPLQIKSKKEEREQSLKQQVQRFFYDCLNAFSQRSQRPLAIIDADSCRAFWDWLTDERINSTNINLADEYHVEENWPQMQIVRVRSDNAPKVLWDKYYFASHQGGEDVRYRAPKWAEADLFKLQDTQNTQVYFSFGSLIRKVPQGVSSYHSTLSLIPTTMNGKRYHVPEQRPSHTDAWTTPTGLEILVIRSGETNPDKIAQSIEWLRQSLAHFGAWASKPAPLAFSSALKQYIADYEMEDQENPPLELEEESEEI
jgi:hypothetical protein